MCSHTPHLSGKYFKYLFLQLPGELVSGSSQLSPSQVTVPSWGKLPHPSLCWLSAGKPHVIISSVGTQTLGHLPTTRQHGRVISEFIQGVAETVVVTASQFISPCAQFCFIKATGIDTRNTPRSASWMSKSPSQLFFSGISKWYLFILLRLADLWILDYDLRQGHLWGGLLHTAHL